MRRIYISIGYRKGDGCVMATFTIRGKNIEITSALREYVEKKVGKVTKYFDTVGEITVLLTVTKGRHIVEVTVPVQGMLLRGEESTMDMYTSIDLVIEKLERQIHKHKTKLERRFRVGSFKSEAMPAMQAASSVDESEEYPVVKTKRFAVKPMDIQEAIMQMNLVNHDFFVYRDSSSEDVNVVYRRKDGNYGLIESGF